MQLAAQRPGTSAVDDRGHVIRTVPGDPPTSVHWEPDADPPVVRNLRPVAHLDPRLAAGWTDPRLTAPAAGLLGVPAVAPLTSKSSLKRARVGSEYAWHTDRTFLARFLDPAAAGEVVTAMVLLDDADPGNGALTLVPGSHRAADRPDGPPGPADAEPEVVAAPAGSVVVFPSGMLHRSDPAFLRLWAGTTASGLATWALPFLLGLAVLDGALSAVDLGVALAARTVGFLAAVPVAVDLRVLVVGTGVLWALAAALPPRGGRRPPADRVGASFLRELGEGLAEARRHRWFTAGLGALTAVIATGYSATAVVLPLVARDRYGSEAVLAAATTAYPVGALLGALLIARWRPRAPGRVALGGLGLYALAPLALLVPVPAAVLVGAYVLVGVGIELFNVPWFTALQREVEPGLLARVSSLDFLLSYGLAPLGLALIAPALDAFGAGPTLLVCVVVCALGPAAAALAPGARDFSRPRRQEV